MKTLFGKCSVEDQNTTLEFYILSINNKYGIEISNKSENLTTSSVLNITEDKNLIYKITSELYKSKTLPENLLDVIEQYF